MPYHFKSSTISNFPASHLYYYDFFILKIQLKLILQIDLLLKNNYYKIYDFNYH